MSKCDLGRKERRADFGRPNFREETEKTPNAIVTADNNVP